MQRETARQFVGALYAEDLELLQDMLRVDPCLANALYPELDDPYRRDRFPVAPLLFAIVGPPPQQLEWHHSERRISRDMVRLLLAHGADPNVYSVHGRPLCWARERALAEMLLQAGADINIWHDNGGAPISFAVWQIDPERMELFLDLGADPNQRNPETAETALHHAVTWALVPGGARPRRNLHLLLDAGADPNARTGADVRASSHGCRVLRGDTPLHEAAFHAPRADPDDVAAVIRALVRAGACPSLANADDMTAAQIAARRGCLDRTVELFARCQTG